MLTQQVAFINEQGEVTLKTVPQFQLGHAALGVIAGGLSDSKASLGFAGLFFAYQIFSPYVKDEPITQTVEDILWFVTGFLFSRALKK